jgi:hypothetical protein
MKLGCDKLASEEEHGLLATIAETVAQHGAHAVPAVEHALADIYDSLPALRAELMTLRLADFNAMLVRSRETPTHYKWHLRTIGQDAYEIWLHEYKPPTSRSSVFSQRVHNHRYGFTSIVLSGGFLHSLYEVTPCATGACTVMCSSSQELTAGMVYSLTAEEFHSVTQVRNRTVTLVAQQRPTRTFSYSVDSETNVLIRHDPIEYRLNSLRMILGGMGR